MTVNTTYRRTPGDLIMFLPGGLWCIIIQVDHQEDTLKIKVFLDMEDALAWKHDASLSQFPEWHSDNCSVCKTLPQV